MLIGEYTHTIDEKNRLIVPAKLRSGIGESFVICKGLEGCLSLYSSAEFTTFSNQLSALPRINKDARELRRFFLGSASEDTFDKQGRVLIPPALKEYADIKKEVSVVGMIDRIEIWDKARWTERSRKTEQQLDEMAKHLEELGVSF